MPPRLVVLAFACAPLLALTGLAAQSPDMHAAPAPFLTGMCAAPNTVVDLDSIVAQPDQPPTVEPGRQLAAFPESLHRPGYEGNISVALIVNADGTVRPNSVAVMSSTDSTLSRWACGAVPALRFVAARHGGRAVATQVMVPFTYRVSADEAPEYLEIQVEKPVQVAHYVLPRYPPELKSRRVQGEVLVSFVVDTTGIADMRTFRVVRSVDDRFLPEIRRTIVGMRFVPAELGGRKVRQRVQQPFGFYIGGVSMDP